jgi:hypothetical protein
MPNAWYWWTINCEARKRPKWNKNKSKQYRQARNNETLTDFN